jgi:hypothetical protein
MRPRPAGAAAEPAAAEAPRHRVYPLPAANTAQPLRERRSRVSRLRRNHPYAGVGTAFLVGAAAGIARALSGGRTRRLSGIRRRWT